MPGVFEDLLPSAEKIRAQAAATEAEKSDLFVRRLVEAELEKRTFIEAMTEDRTSTDKRIRLLSGIIKRAADGGLGEVQLCRFPSSLCTDGGRAIARLEEGWEATLTGFPKDIHRLWQEHLRSRGYRIRYQSLKIQDDGEASISILVSWDEE
jgi:hypothetical protein